MASAIWKRCDGSARIRPLSASPWRVVEAQHIVATRKLVDSDEEHRVLESLIDSGKPPTSPTIDTASLHYLLWTPFRYPPLRHGSRFGTRSERGIWYGSERPRTAFAETSYYRLLFLEGTKADITPLSIEMSTFRARVRARRGIDLCKPPFIASEKQLTSPTRYASTQALGAQMRKEAVQTFRFRSARDPRRGTNIGVFDPITFGRRPPEDLQTWHCVVERHGVEWSRKDFFDRSTHRFARSDFTVRDALPRPAV